MPTYEVTAKEYEISRNAIIFDSGLLIAAFSRNSDKRAAALYFLDQAQDTYQQWIVPIGVVVETWGFIVGKNSDWTEGSNFLDWLNTPGKNLIVIGHDGDVLDEQRIIGSLRVDCVDSMIATLATRLFHACGLTTSIPVATWDTRDFYRLAGQSDIKIQLYDLNEGMLQDLG